jgi:hypothetical protein
MDRVLLYVCHRRCISRRNAALLLESETVISQKTDVLLMKAHSDDEFDIPSPTAAVLAQSSGYYCNFK